MEKMKRRLPSILVQGFLLTLRNWPCVVWAYAVNLVLGLVAGIPFASGLTSYLDHSLAAEKIAGTIDLAYLGELAIHLHGTGFFPMTMRAAEWLNMLQLLLLFILFAGSVFVFVSAEPPRFSVLLRAGVAYFFRFARAAILAGFLAVVLLGFLLSVRAAILARAGAVYVERRMFFYSLGSGAVVLLAALLVRLWWDLVEIYIVRNGMDGERSVRRALLPALRLLYRHFFRAFGSFLLTGFAGAGALALCLYLWKNLVPAHGVWIACVLAQTGLFLLLAGRFWQRGLEVILVMSADPPMALAEEEIITRAEEEVPVSPSAEVLTGISEPTLRDLVLKLQNEPWANPEVVSKPVEGAEGKEASLLDRRPAKFPFGPSSGPDPDDGLSKTPQSGKKPLP